MYYKVVPNDVTPRCFLLLQLTASAKDGPMPPAADGAQDDCDAAWTGAKKGREIDLFPPLAMEGNMFIST